MLRERSKYLESLEVQGLLSAAHEEVVGAVVDARWPCVTGHAKAFSHSLSLCCLELGPDGN